MSDYVIPKRAPSCTQSDAYLILLGGVLFGYAMFGKGFAYVGIPPLFIGEMAILLGIVVFLRSGCLFASMATLPAVVLSVTMAWVLLRTVPYFRHYGFDAARDSVIVMYGIFAFIVIAMLLQDPGRIRTIMQRYSAFTGIFIFSMLVLFPLQRFLIEYIPDLPGQVGVPLVKLGAHEVATHLCGATVFAMAGFRKTTLGWTLALAVLLVILLAVSRSATLAMIVPICFAAVMLGHGRKLIIIAISAGLLFSFAYAIEKFYTETQDQTFLATAREPLDSLSRRVTPSQIADNFASLFGQGNKGHGSTTEWRLGWWEITLEDTVFGDYFWTGRGFGANLIEAHGLSSEYLNPNVPPTRSPHNASITMLARAGVPGLALWTLLSIVWFLLILKTMLDARRHGRTDWANLFLVVFCYVLAIHIVAMFNVTLENPMMGIWYWCLFGFGLGTVMIYQAQQREYRDMQ